MSGCDQQHNLILMKFQQNIPQYDHLPLKDLGDIYFDLEITGLGGKKLNGSCIYNQFEVIC